jgi:hypothetical protein
MRWVGHVARIGKLRNTYKLFVSENLKIEGYLMDIGIRDWRIILRLTIDKYAVRMATGFSWPRIGFSGGFL